MKQLLVPLLLLLSSALPASAAPLCRDFFRDSARGPIATGKPSPPLADTSTQQVLQEVQTREQGTARWLRISKALGAAIKPFASFQAEFRSSFWDFELNPEVKATLARWKNFEGARTVVFDNLYRALNPDHPNYRHGDRDGSVDAADVARVSARVFPKDQPIIARIGKSFEILHNGSRLSNLELTAILAREIPAELPDGMIAVFRGLGLAERARGQEPFVLFRPEENDTRRPLTDNEIRSTVLELPANEQFAPLPKSAVIIQKPAQVPAGAIVEYGLRLNYSSLRYRNRAVIPFLGYVMVKDGKVIEIGAGSRALAREVQAQLADGRAITPTERAEIAALSTDLFAAIGDTAASKAVLADFRGWDPGLVAESRVVHLDPATFDVKSWALDWGARRGFGEEKTIELLQLAGWAEVSFNRFGRMNVRVLAEKGDLIPFFKDDAKTKISYFRMRRSDPKPGMSKYREFPELYSITNSPREDEVYYTPRIRGLPSAPKAGGWFRGFVAPLNRWIGATSKTLVVTEGEFKALVAEWYGSHPVVALSGIHSFNHELVAEIVQLARRREAREIVVIFDGDPTGKGWARADGLSDSKRQAYVFGRELEEAIAADPAARDLRVKVGILPSSGKPGGKDAIDDAILENPAAGVKAYEDTVRDALSLPDYARSVKLDEALVDLFVVHRGLGRTLTELRAGKATGRAFAADVEHDLADGEATYARVTEALRRHLIRHYRTENLYTAEKTISRLPPAGARADFKPAGTVSIVRNGERVDLTEFFRHEVILVPTVPRDGGGGEARACANAACFAAPFSAPEIAGLARTGETARADLEIDYAKGLEIARAQGFAPTAPQDHRALALAGHLALRVYPGEVIELGVRVGQQASIPTVLVRRKSSGNAIGLFLTQAEGAEATIAEIWRTLRPGMVPRR